MEIGGGFGGKISVYLEPLAVVLSRCSGGRPVKLTMSRGEVLAATGPTSGSYIRVKMGAARDGRITAAQAYLAYEAGAYPGSPVGSGCSGDLCALSHREPPDRRLRCGGQQAAYVSLPCAGRHQRGLCRRDGHRRTGRKAGHRPAGVPAAQRRAAKATGRPTARPIGGSAFWRRCRRPRRIRIIARRCPAPTAGVALPPGTGATTAGNRARRPA